MNYSITHGNTNIEGSDIVSKTNKKKNKSDNDNMNKNRKTDHPLTREIKHTMEKPTRGLP